MGKVVIGIGLPKTGTSTLKEALRILGVNAEVGDYVHFMKSWDSDILILTTRLSEEVWYESVLRWNEKVGGMKNIQDQRVKMYGTSQPKEYWKNIYLHHNSTCRKLPNVVELCWEKGHGWKELCAIVKKPIPNVAFPHLKKTNNGTSR